MAFSERFLEELTERSDIVDVVSEYVHLTKKSGANLFGLCPFHSEKTPSFSVCPSRQMYHCFGCGKGGGVINFIMEVENLRFPDAVAFLARRAGMELPEEEAADGYTVLRRRLFELEREAALWFHEQLKTPDGETARQYMARRGISASTARRFGLGYAPDSWNSLGDAMKARGFTEQELLDGGLAKRGRNGGVYDAFRGRLMFPVIDVRGSVIGFSGRILGDGEPKYLNSPETMVFSKSRNLFALNLAKKSKSGYIILSEGNIDVVSLHQAGFDSAVASLGTSLTPEQARLLSHYTQEIVIAYDADAAGQKAAQRAIGILEKLDLRVRVLNLSGAKDPDEMIREKGPEAFRKLLEASEGQVDYRLGVIRGKYDLSAQDGKVAYLQEAAALLARLPSDVEREVFALRVAEEAGVSREAVLADVKRLRSRLLSQARRGAEKTAARPAQNVQPKERGLRYDDPRSARAEEGVIRLLYQEPELFRKREPISPEQFSSPVLRRLYAELLQRVQNGMKPSMAVLAETFSPEEVSLLTGILQKPETPGNAGKALEDYIGIIGNAGSGSSDDELLALAEKYRKTKGYGG
ncbi:MAG: DNA primase [Eubacteriales bacterium]|nr:DNA primase [Eubacteriales bacterium]